MAPPPPAPPWQRANTWALFSQVRFCPLRTESPKWTLSSTFLLPSSSPTSPDVEHETVRQPCFPGSPLGGSGAHRLPRGRRSAGSLGGPRPLGRPGPPPAPLALLLPQIPAPCLSCESPTAVLSAPLLPAPPLPALSRRPRLSSPPPCPPQGSPRQPLHAECPQGLPVPCSLRSPPGSLSVPVFTSWPEKRVCSPNVQRDPLSRGPEMRSGSVWSWLMRTEA